MARKPRLFVPGTTYHVYCRVARGEFVFDDPYEAEEFVEKVREVRDADNWRILAWCLMGNHFHLLVKMFPEYKFTDEDIRKRYAEFYGDDRAFPYGQVPSLREKLSNLSEFVREIKVGYKVLQPTSQPTGLFLGRPV